MKTRRAVPADPLSRRMDIAATHTAQAAEELAAIACKMERRSWTKLALLQRHVAELVHDEIEAYERGQEVW